MPLKIRPNAIEQEEGRFPFPGIILNDDLTIDDGAFIDTKGGSGTIHYDGLSLHSLDPQTSNDKPLQLRGSTAGIFLDTGEEILLAQSSLVEWNRPRNDVDHRWWSVNYGAALHVDGQFARVGVGGVTAPLYALHVGGGNVFLSGTATIDGAGPADVGIMLRADADLRWFIRRTAGGEDFAITRYSPSGTFLGTEFLISDTSGDISISKYLTVQRGFIANYDQGNYDTRISTQNRQYAIFADANLDRIGVLAGNSLSYPFQIGAETYISGSVHVDGPATQRAGLRIRSADTMAWFVSRTEAGRYAVARYDGGGSYIDDPFVIDDGTGDIGMHVGAPTYGVHIGKPVFVSGTMTFGAELGTNVGVIFQTAGVQRWFTYRDSGGEYRITRYDSGGVFQDHALTIHNDDARVVLAGALYVNGQVSNFGTEDSRFGILRVHGHETGSSGGRVQMYASADYDDTVDYWAFDTNQRDMRFWSYHGTHGFSLKAKLTTGSFFMDIPIDMKELAADPATPSSGYGRVFARDDGRVYFLDDGGNVWDLLSGGFA